MLNQVTQVLSIKNKIILLFALLVVAKPCLGQITTVPYISLEQQQAATTLEATKEENQPRFQLGVTTVLLSAACVNLRYKFTQRFGFEVNWWFMYAPSSTWPETRAMSLFSPAFLYQFSASESSRWSYYFGFFINGIMYERFFGNNYFDVKFGLPFLFSLGYGLNFN